MLPVTLGEGEHQVTSVAEFVIIDRTSEYNAILPTLHTPLESYPVNISSSDEVPNRSRDSYHPRRAKNVKRVLRRSIKGCAVIRNDVQSSNKSIQGTPTKELELVPLLSSDKQVNIGTQFGAEMRAEVINFL